STRCGDVGAVQDRLRRGDTRRREREAGPDVDPAAVVVEGTDRGRTPSGGERPGDVLVRRDVGKDSAWGEALMFRVRYTRNASNQLAVIWTNATDQNAVTVASH